MRKSISSFTKPAATAIFALILASCHFEAKSITGSGNVTTTNRNMQDDFTAIDVEKGIDVVVEQSDSRAVMVEADDNLQSHIHTTVANGTLKITSDYGNYNNVTSKKVIVRLPVIKELNSSSGSNISSKSVLKGDNVMLKASSGSNIEVLVDIDHLRCETSSGSHITVNGKALELETESSSGSEIDARDLLANDVTSQSSSGSSTNIHPIMSLKAKASSGSSIDYVGEPKKVERNESSGGDVSGK